MNNSRRMIFDFFQGPTRYLKIFGLALVLVVTLIVIYGCWNLLEARRSAWENRCKITLRSLGSAQLSFFYGHNEEYGTWDELMKEDFVQKGDDQLNYIDNYEIMVFDVQKSIKNSYGTVTESSFTIVAVPRNPRNGLRTFALGTAQSLRHWVGKSEEFDIAHMGLENPSHWEPLK
jgi:hypothetical protein